jgi:hypothetical protein
MKDNRRCRHPTSNVPQLFNIITLNITTKAKAGQLLAIPLLLDQVLNYKIRTSDLLTLINLSPVFRL